MIIPLECLSFLQHICQLTDHIKHARITWLKVVVKVSMPNFARIELKMLRPGHILIMPGRGLFRQIIGVLLS